MSNDLSPQEREKRAAEYAAEAKQTAEMAFRAQEAARLSGERPVLSEVQDSVMEKLKKHFPADRVYEDGGAGEENPA